MVRDITIAAFTDSRFGHNGEADLIDALTRSVTDHIAFVATIDTRIVGHILLTPAVIRGEHPDQYGMGLGPMSVLPACQRQGIGTALVTRSLQSACVVPCDFVAVLGHPEYYPRFGFEPASTVGVTHGFAGISQEPFFLRTNPTRKSGILPGKLFYHSAFGEQYVTA